MSRSRSTIRVVHVDDEPGFAELTAEYVESEHDALSVETTDSPSEALALLASREFDCVVSDYEMPEMNGLAFLDSVREAYPDIPFILFTGKGSEDLASEAISRGVSDYLQKQGGTDQYVLLANRITNLVEQYRSEKSLQRERERTGALFTNAADAIAYFEFEDGEPVIRDVNPAFEETFGVSARDASGTVLDALVVPEEYRSEGREINERVSSGEIIETEVDRRTPDGRRTFILRSVPLNPGTSGERGFAIYTDITDRVGSRRDLERYRTLVETVGDPMYMLNPSGEITMVNEAACHQFGYDEEELLGRPASEFAVDEDARRLTETIADLLDSDEQWTTEELRFRTSDGETVVTETKLSALLEDGEFIGSVGVVRDITERKRQAAELERERDRLQLLVDTLPTPVMYGPTSDEGPIIREVNPAFEEVFGYDAETIEGEPLDELIVPDDVDNETINRRVVEEGSFEAEVRRQTADGIRDFHLQTAVAPFNDPDAPSPYEGWAIYTDITEQKERQRRLQRQNERLEKFAGVVSHDLRNPLDVAKGRLDVARSAYDDDEHLRKVSDALNRMEALIDDLLALARQGQRASDLETVHLSTVAEDCWETVSTDGATLVVDADRRIRADSRRLRELFENLFRNAMEHGSAGSRTASGDVGERGAVGSPTGSDDAGDVTVRVGPLDDGFYVADDGVGVPEPDREEVFDTGFSTADYGTGFGLAIVEEIAEAHDWSVALTDSEDGGARFEITGVDVVGD